MSDLKPCPFCGGEILDVIESGLLRVVECGWCSALGGTIDEDAGDGESTWNTRPEEDRLRSEVAELVAALRDARQTIVSVIDNPRGISGNFLMDAQAHCDAVLSKHEDK